MSAVEAISRHVETPTASARDCIVPTHFAHFVIYSSQFDKITAWYKMVLCPLVTFEDDHLAFLTFDDEHHRVAIVNVPNLEQQRDNIASVHHVAFTFSSLSDLLVTWKRLSEADVQPEWAVNHGPTTSIYYLDPDRNRIEFQVDNFDTAAAAIAYCALPEFRENPVGVDFNPGELLERLLSGEAESVLKRRPNVGPRSEGRFTTV